MSKMSQQDFHDFLVTIHFHTKTRTMEIGIHLSSISITEIYLGSMLHVTVVNPTFFKVHALTTNIL